LRAIPHQSLSSVVASHGVLHIAAAAVVRRAEPRCSRVDSAICVEPLAVEPTIPVMALVRICAHFPRDRKNQRASRMSRSISVDAQYFACAVFAMFLASFLPARPPNVLTLSAVAAATASIVLSIQTAFELVTAPPGSELRVPMPVIGIDWMQVTASSRCHLHLCQPSNLTHRRAPCLLR
jgi:hypothetical protein